MCDASHYTSLNRNQCDKWKTNCIGGKKSKEPVEVIANTQVPWAVILHKSHFLNHVVPDAFDLKFSSAADFSCFNYLYHSWPEKPLKHFLAAWWPFQGTLSSWQHRSHNVYASGAVVSSIMVHTDTGDRNSEKEKRYSLYYERGQEPITRSLHTNYTLESTLCRIFSFLELRYVGWFFDFPRKHADVCTTP